MITNFDEKFLAFAKAKPPEEAYHIMPAGTCALGQFVATEGYYGLMSTYWNKKTKESFQFPPSSWQAAMAINQIGQQTTWGELTKRLEVLLK